MLIFDNILNSENPNDNKCTTELENISKSNENTIKKIIFKKEAFSGLFNGYKKLKIIWNIFEIMKNIFIIILYLKIGEPINRIAIFSIFQRCEKLSF